MLQNRATLSDIRLFLLEECSLVYPPGEGRSVASFILDYLGISMLRTHSEPGNEPGAAIIAQINEIVSEIPSLRPIQYILGETSFFDLTLKVDERVLIPRSETEELIHLVKDLGPENPASILDLGTGSGCIALALKKIFPEAMVCGLEKEEAALELARENGQLNKLEIEWILADMLRDSWPKNEGGYSIVISNPPYVRESEKDGMEANVLDHEPFTALFVEDGNALLYYRHIAEKARKVMAPGAMLWLEINEALGADMIKLLEAFHYREVNIYKDIHGKERFAKALL